MLEGCHLGEYTPEALCVLAGDVPTPGSSDGEQCARARAKWLNTIAFFARIWTAGVRNEASSAIPIIGRTLEPFSVDPTHAGKRRRPSWMDFPPELDLEAVAVWFKFASALIHECRKLTVGPDGRQEWRMDDGDRRTYPDGWALWKSTLQAVVAEDWRPSVLDAVNVSTSEYFSLSWTDMG